MTLDDKALRGLIEESQDLQSDATTKTTESLDELVEAGKERRARGGLDPEEGRQEALARRDAVRRGLASGGVLALAAFGGTLLALSDSPAFASQASDIQRLQTQASIEALAVKTYAAALGLSYIGGSSANATVKAFAQTTMAQHQQHLQAFNSAAQSLGGKTQTNPDPHYVPAVNSTVARIGSQSPTEGTLSVVSLAITLENVAAETYVANTSKFKDANAKKITASVMGVEAQHVATLLAVQALLKGGAPQLITLSPTVVASLPSAAGSVGCPNSFYPTVKASPASEGAVS